MSKKKETRYYPVPEDLALIIHNCMAAYDLRDIYAKKMFGFRKARQCAREYRVLRDKFWRRVLELYPHLKQSEQLNYSVGRGVREESEAPNAEG